MKDMKNNCKLVRAVGEKTLYFVFSLLCVMLLGGPVLAQDESADEEEFTLEEIRVTGSIIKTTGIETPTPVTVITLDEVTVLSPTTVIEGLAELPQFYMSNTTQNAGNFFETTGPGTLNL